jgi:hypothetical protein
MSQLVGSRCLRCEQEIWIVSEGCFCLDCGSPHHFLCKRPDATPAGVNRCLECGCNLDNPFAVRFREEQRQKTEAAVRRTARCIFAAVLLLQLVVLVNFAVAAWITRKLVNLDPMAGGVIGGVLLLLIVVGQVAVLPLYRRRKWAWIVAIVAFVLALPSLVGFIGLVLLFRPSVRQEFE